ncbi:MAG TPA: ferredoxin, partial [Clostridiaceae bacterium]|nr:ferredoxin [Clostridiaceae bacterium]
EMIRESGIDFRNLEDEEFDDPMGEATGAGVIFGATGGVMEAALRSVPYLLTGKDDDTVDITAVRGTEGIKEAEVEVAGVKIKAAVAHGLGNARKLLDKVRSGEADYQFIEIMACPGGCVCGGGQPIQPAAVRNEIDLKKERAKALYQEDKNLPIRRSHQNPRVLKMYEEYFEKPGSHKSHKLLHTHYTARENYPEDKC